MICQINILLRQGLVSSHASLRRRCVKSDLKRVLRSSFSRSNLGKWNVKTSFNCRAAFFAHQKECFWYPAPLSLCSAHLPFKSALCSFLHFRKIIASQKSRGERKTCAKLSARENGKPTRADFSEPHFDENEKDLGELWWTEKMVPNENFVVVGVEAPIWKRGGKDGKISSPRLRDKEAWDRGANIL